MQDCSTPLWLQHVETQISQFPLQALQAVKHATTQSQLPLSTDLTQTHHGFKSALPWKRREKIYQKTGEWQSASLELMTLVPDQTV